MTEPLTTIKTPDASDPESLNLFFERMEQFVAQIPNDVMREEMETALDRMRLINAN